MEVNTDGLRIVTCGKYTYTITTRDLQMEQEAFEAGEGVSRPVNMVPVINVKKPCDLFVSLRKESW